jgi:putative DNA primase/helicase
MSTATPPPRLSPVGRAARLAMDCGISVVPPTEAPGTNWEKAPSPDAIDKPSDWKQYQKVIPSDARFKFWYRSATPRAGLGFVCGAVSGNLEVMDFDDRIAWEQFQRRADEFGIGDLVDRVKSGYSSRTPSGGVHLAWRCEVIAGCYKLAMRPAPTKEDPRKQVTLIEMKGEGGYTVEPPTEGVVHKSGKPYELLAGGPRTIRVITPDERDALLSLARSFDERPAPEHKEEHKPRREPAADGTKQPGDDFEERHTWEDILGPLGWTMWQQVGEVRYWRRPGKDAGNSACTNKTGNNTLKVFSTSTPFDIESTYSKFGAYALLNHGGDHSEAARSLMEQGYGTHIEEVPDPADRRKLVKVVAPNPRPAPRARHESNGKTHRNGTAVLEPPPIEAPAATPEIPPPELPAVAGEEPINRTDLGNARRFANQHRKSARYCTPWKAWFVWDGARWKRDESGKVRRLGRKVVRSIAAEAAAEENDAKRKAILAWALSTESRKHFEAMVSLAESEEGIAVAPEEWDQDPWLLNCLNGTIDLRTGELKPHRKEDLITKVCPVEYDPDAKAPRWEQFMREIFAGDEDLIAYMTRVAGMSLAAVDFVQELYILYGEGSNGKNVYLDTIQRILGDYADQAEPSLLLSSKNESHPTGVADLHGKRFISASETDDGRKLAVALVKRLTGDGVLKARRMRENFFTFKRTFKLLLATNYKPEIPDTGNAIWRRVRLIPFLVKFVKKGQATSPPMVMPEDDTLKLSLSEEAPGILALLVRGCLEWQRDGMNPPAAVLAATDEYRKESDTFATFIADECVLDSALADWADPRSSPFKAKADRLYDRYQAWFKSSGERELLPSRKFNAELRKRGMHSYTNNGTWFAGIGLRNDEHQREPDSGPAF